MRKLNNQQTYRLCDQLALIIRSGVPLYDGMETLLNEETDSATAEVLKQLQRQLNEHGSLAIACERSSVFDLYLVEMIRIGEKSGYLEQVLSSLAHYYRRLDNMQSKIKEVLIYPGILLLTMLLVISIIVFKVFPVFQTVFNSLGTSMSAPAVLLMQIGSFLARYGLFGLIILTVMIVIVAVVYYYRYHEEAMMMFLTRFVITRRFMDEMAVAQLAYAMSLLLKSGYDSDETMKFMPQVISHPQLKARIQTGLLDMHNGSSFLQVMKAANIFKGLYMQMITLGVKVGKLDETMKQVADLYETEVSTSIDQFLDRIEPTLTVIMALIVGVILLSVMLPLLSIMNSLG
ncbi:MAG: type II secretion system F family protein [Erysipelotrichaceae bacterium]|nr:type II secretion system F family protein [Erysipelotrichaceae bacterium]